MDVITVAREIAADAMRERRQDARHTLTDFDVETFCLDARVHEVMQHPHSPAPAPRCSCIPRAHRAVAGNRIQQYAATPCAVSRFPARSTFARM